RPPAMTFAEPKRSAIIPAKGCAMPHTRFCSPMARPKVSRDQPRSRLTGSRKSPCAWRAPSARPMTIPPASTSTQALRYATPGVRPAAMPGPARSARGRDRELERILEPVVAPEHLLADEEGRRAEQPAPLGLFRLFAQGELVLVREGACHDRLDRQSEATERAGDRLDRVDVHVAGEVHPHDLAAEVADPGFIGAGQRDAQRGERWSRERARPLQLEPVLAALSFDVAPGVLALRLLFDEWGRLPADGAEDRSEQDGLPLHSHAPGRCGFLDPHHGQVAVVTREVEPDLDGRRSAGAGIHASSPDVDPLSARLATRTRPGRAPRCSRAAVWRDARAGRRRCAA